MDAWWRTGGLEMSHKMCNKMQELKFLYNSNIYFPFPNASKYPYNISFSALPNAAKNLTTNLSLDTFSRLHNTLISADENALANLSQPPDKLAILTPHNLTQLIAAQPNTLCRL
jgi:tRNA A37 threonylcarbamoyltransferase TsaD